MHICKPSAAASMVLLPFLHPAAGDGVHALLCTAAVERDRTLGADTELWWQQGRCSRERWGNLLEEIVVIASKKLRKTLVLTRN